MDLNIDAKSEQERKINNLLEENNALRQQIIELQNVATTGGASYLQAAMGRKMSISQKEGKVLLVPKIPDPVRHVPSEKILIFKAKEKGEQVSKKEQEVFQKEIRTAIGEEMTKEIKVIRPTRYGGHTIVFQSEIGRDKALEKLRENKNVTKTINSCIISPQKKIAKVLCREPPEDVKENSFIADMFNARNAHLCKVPKESREVKIYNSQSLGWIFEVFSMEAQVIYLQGGRIRYGYGRECKVEEFIPLQQCYKCCIFGHNAVNCTSPIEYCRLCGRKGHAGKDCNKKNDKKCWSCINCKITNDTKSYNLPTDHAAA